MPSPCGPNSQCREVGNVPVCSCQPGYMGVPPECRPECVSSSECPPSLACINFKCQDPCTGTCGRDAECRVLNHNPTCVCPSGWTGDPLTGCSPIPSMSKFVNDLCRLTSFRKGVEISARERHNLTCCLNICSVHTQPTRRSSYATSSPAQSLHTNTLWSKLAMSSGFRPSAVRLFGKYDWH